MEVDVANLLGVVHQSIKLDTWNMDVFRAGLLSNVSNLGPIACTVKF